MHGFAMSSFKIIQPTTLKNMTKKIIDKNFALSASFTKYAVKNPEIMEDLPKKTCLVFADKSDSYLTRVNMNLAREAKKEGEKIGRASCRERV